MRNLRRCMSVFLVVGRGLLKGFGNPLGVELGCALWGEQEWMLSDWAGGDFRSNLVGHVPCSPGDNEIDRAGAENQIEVALVHVRDHFISVVAVQGEMAVVDVHFRDENMHAEIFYLVDEGR